MVSIANNPLLNCLDIQSSDKIISIKENGNVDSNFIITHLIKQILNDNSKLCLVILHNTIGHYHNVGKRLGYDFLKKAQEGAIHTIEPLKDIVEDIGTSDSELNYLIDDKERIVRVLFENIQNSIGKLSNSNNNNRVYLVIDDISHLLDLGIDLKYVISFINNCLNLVNNEKIFIVINTHVCSKSDEIVSNQLNYCSDVNIEVSPLKTGISREVTGLLNIEKSNGKFNKNETRQFHFKAYDKGIKTFHLGEAVYNLYK